MAICRSIEFNYFVKYTNFLSLIWYFVRQTKKCFIRWKLWVSTKQLGQNFSISEEKGSFKRFCHSLGGRAITEFNYRYAGCGEAQIFVGVGLRNGQQELTELTASLHQNGYLFDDLSDNELAKLHVRYMVGGKPPSVMNERLLRFEFPEYPGALARFLDMLGCNWNITLFHYILI